MSDIENGMFGDKEYFKPLVDSVSNMKVGHFLEFVSSSLFTACVLYLFRWGMTGSS